MALGRERIWRGVLWTAAAVTLGLGAVQAVREEQLGSALPPGSPVPAFTSVGQDGRPFRLEDSQAKVVVLSFWATWCTPCQRELPMLRKLEAEFATQGVALVLANVDDEDDQAEALARWAKDLSGPAPRVVFPDEQTRVDWRSGRLPTLYVLAREAAGWAIVASHSNLQPEERVRSELRTALDRAKKGN